MLNVTDAAAEIIHIIVDQAAPGESGLRISPQIQPEGETVFAIATSQGPTAEDLVVEARDGDARIYLEPAAALLLDDQILDASVSEQGEVAFILATWPPETS
jgi:iron-sulfur cluster assembly protein